MTRTIWLASFPKSGNTWLRILIANASVSVVEPVNINEMADCGMAGDRGSFDYAVLIDSGLLTHDEIDGLRPRVYAELIRQAAESTDMVRIWNAVLDECRVPSILPADVFIPASK